MDEKKFNQMIQKLNEYEGVQESFLLNSEGAVLYKSPSSCSLPNEEAKAILEAWKEKKSALIYQNFRYAILKNDDIQLAAKNISGGKGNIVGSITKEGNSYLLVHTVDTKDMILLEWSIAANKVAWS